MAGWIILWGIVALGALRIRRKYKLGLAEARQEYMKALEGYKNVEY